MFCRIFILADSKIGTRRWFVPICIGLFWSRYSETQQTTFIANLSFAICFFVNIMNPFRIINLLQQKVFTRWSDDISTENAALSAATVDEENIASQFCTLLDDIITGSLTNIECYSTLDFKDKYDPEFEQGCISDPMYGYEFDTELATTVHSFSFETMKKIYDLHENGRSVKSIIKLYSKIRNKKQLYRILDYVKKGGTYRTKIKQIKEHIYQRFQFARNNDSAVHDNDLRKWEIKFARSIGLDNFTASDHFLNDLKTQMHVRSRKVTHVTTLARRENEEEIKQQAIAHVAKVNEQLPFVDVAINADQSSFVQEFYSNRTLSHVGEKKNL